jgi:hypothetical protein
MLGSMDFFFILESKKQTPHLFPYIPCKKKTKKKPLNKQQLKP